MENQQGTVNVILKTVGLGMATASLVLGILNATTAETNVVLLGIGLFAISLLALREKK
jgi:hypothetical protein